MICKQSKKIESGRSMVEMLGVLAIIGVLSIAGIKGYSAAMSRHKANEIMHSISIANTAAQLGQKTEFLPVSGVTFDTNPSSNHGGSVKYFVVNISDKAVCEAIKQLATGPYYVEGNCN